MKFIITESKYEKVKNTIKKSIDEVGFIETIKRYKLPIESLDHLLEKEDGNYFSPNQLRKILLYYILTAESLPYRFEMDPYEISLEDISGYHRYTTCDLAVIKNKYGGSLRYGLSGFFDPFIKPRYSDDSFGTVLFNWYTKGDWALHNMHYVEIDRYDKTYTFDPPKISSMKELKDWYLNVVPQEIIKNTEKFIEYVEEQENIQKHPLREIDTLTRLSNNRP